MFRKIGLASSSRAGYAARTRRIRPHYHCIANMSSAIRQMQKAPNLVKSLTSGEARAQTNIASMATKAGPSQSPPKDGAIDVEPNDSVANGPANDDVLESPAKKYEDTADSEDRDEYLTTIFEKMEPYLDTYEVYKLLIQADFTPKQSDEIIHYLILQINAKVLKLSTKYSQIYELENERYLFESAQQELRVDITRSREQHINELINLINILERDFNIISDELNNDFLQMKNDTQVTMNDQKSENTLHSKRINLRIQETNHKITTELNSAMRSEIESLRWHISRWGIMAILMSVFAGCATFYVYKIKAARRLNEKNGFVPLVIYEPSEIEEDDYHTDLDKNLIN